MRNANSPFLFVGTLVCALFIAGCNKVEVPPPLPSPVSTENMDVKPASITEKDLATIRGRLSVLEAQMRTADTSEAVVSSGDSNFGIAKTVFGPFTVAVVGMTPYLDGFNAKLRVGNVTAAEFNGAKVSVAWGPPLSAGAEAYLSQRKTKEFDITNTFRSGTFTEITVSLTPAKPEEVKELDVGLKLSQISLRTNR